MEVRLNNSLGGVVSTGVQYGSDADLAKVLLFRGYPQPLLHLASACCVVFILIGIPGNITTIVALAKCEKARNATAVFIISLHISDLIMCTLILPITAMTFAQKHWTHGWIMCRVYPYFKYVLQATSTYTILAISINRYVIVCHPLWYSSLYNKRNLSIMLLVLWMSAFTIYSVTLFEVWGRLDLDSNIGFCTIIRDKYDRSPKKFYLSINVLVPFIITVLCYARIWSVVRKSAKRSQDPHDIPTSTRMTMSTSDNLTIKTAAEDPSTSCNDASPNEEKTIHKHFKPSFRLSRREVRPKVPSKRDKKLNTMITAIMVSFCITYIPTMVTKLMYRRFGPIPHVLGHLFVNAGSCINPIIYVLMSYEYRQAYKSLYQDIMKQFWKQ